MIITESIAHVFTYIWIPSGSAVKNPPACSVGDIRSMSLIPGLGRTPGGGHGNPLQYSCLENSMDEEPDGLPTVGLQRVAHTEAT